MAKLSWHQAGWDESGAGFPPFDYHVRRDGLTRVYLKVCGGGHPLSLTKLKAAPASKTNHSGCSRTSQHRCDCNSSAGPRDRSGKANTARAVSDCCVARMPTMPAMEWTCLEKLGFLAVSSEEEQPETQGFENLARGPANPGLQVCTQQQTDGELSLRILSSSTQSCSHTSTSKLGKSGSTETRGIPSCAPAGLRQRMTSLIRACSPQRAVP